MPVWPGVALFATMRVLMVISIANIGVAHAEYYTSEEALGAVSYYADGGEHSGVWVSGGGWSMTAGTAVTVDTLKAALSYVDPGTGERLGRRYTPGGTYRDPLGVERLRRSTSAFDLTYSVPKSISASWAVADTATRRQLQAAYDVSLGAVVDYVQANAVASRKGVNGVERIDVPDGAAIARFDHYTSRAGDPQLHTHLLVMNRVLCSDGKWRTLDGRIVYDHLQAASMYGAAVLRAEISGRLGWSWDRIGTNRHAEIAGVPTDLVAHWSTRRRVVARKAQEKVRHFEKTRHREPTPEQRLRLWDEATVQTRERKRDDLGKDLYRGWRADAIDLGHDPVGLISSYPTAERLHPDRYDNPEVMVGPWPARVDDRLADHVLATVEQYSVDVSDEQLTMLLYSVINASPLLAGSGVVDGRARIDETYTVLRRKVSERLVRHDGRWYSPGLVAAEVSALSWLAADAPAATLVADPDVEGLSTDQAAAVGILAGTRTNGTVVVGPAGAGKTTMLARFAQAVGPGRVVAVAPTAVAAAQLGGSLGVQADTVAKILLDPERIPAGAWLIVDEATQLATREMAALCGRAQAAGARLVLVGDHAQQGSVTAGGVFASAARSGTVQVAPLSELWRFSDPAEAAATARLRVGNPAALRYHHRHGRVSSAAYTETAATVGDWWEQHRDEATLISAPSHALVGQINAEIAARRAAAGETGPAVAGDGDRAIRIGDVITTRRNNRRVCASDNKWVRNGDRWIVEWTLGGGGLRARRAAHPYIRVDLPAGYVAEHVDLGYAVTHTRAQSTTVDAALTVVGASTRLPELYVGLTRGRNHNHLVVVTDRPAHDEDNPTQHLPPAEVIAAVLSHSSNQRTAIEPHQGTLDTHEAAHHLQAVAETAHTAPLPTLDGFDTTAVLAARGAPTHSKATDLLEQRVRGAIDQWLAGLDGDALYEGLTDTEKTEVDQRLEAMLGGEDSYDTDHGSYEPSPADRAHLELDPADDEPGTVYPTDADAAPPPPFDEDDLEGWWDDTEDQIPDDLPAGWWNTAPAVADPDAPTFDYDDDTDDDLLATEQWLTDLGATSRVSELAVEIVTVAAGADPAEMFTPFPTTTPDNPELLTLTRRYSQAAYVAADEAAARTATLIAAVADAPLRDMLDPLVDRTLLSDDDSSWAQTVRADVLSRRAARWAETLGALDTLRDTIRAQTERLVASGAHPQAVEAAAVDQVVDHDREVWQQHCIDWLDAGAAPAELLTRWAQTDRSLADVAAGRHTPLPHHPDRAWTNLTSHPAPAPLPAETTDTVADGDEATAAAPRPDVVAPQPPNDRDAARLRGALREATGFYHRQLLHSPDAAEARRYLQKRGISPDEWETWQLGWAPDSWQAVTDLIGNNQLAVEAGLATRARSGRVYDTIRGRIMFPVRSHSSDVVGFSGRSTDPDQPSKYVNTARTRLYNKSQLLFGLSHAAGHIAASGEAVLVEGYTDVIAAHRNGLTNTVGTGGTAYTHHHAAALAAVEATEITVMYDGDPAGRASTRRVCAVTTLAGLPLSVVNLPGGKDPDDMDPDGLRDAHQAALPHLWAQIAGAEERWDLSDPVEAAKAVDYILAVADGDPILELIAAQQASALLSLPLDSILDTPETELDTITAAGTATRHGGTYTPGNDFSAAI